MTKNKKELLKPMFAVIFGIIMIAADQLTKVYFLNLFENSNESIPVIKGVISFYLVHNNGAGFSILSGHTMFLIIFTAIALLAVMLLFISRKLKSLLSDWGLCLIISGGIGNMIDRIWRNGNVVDFIKTDFIDFPIFNVADICITVGAGLLILYFIIDLIKDSKKKKEADTDNGEA